MTRRKINPNTNIQYADKTFQLKSQMSNNDSMMNIGYLTVQEATVSRCWHCKSTGSVALMSICDCLDRLFHEVCFRQWLKNKVDAPGINVTTQNGISSTKCQQCEYDIKFRLESKSRIRNCKEVGCYCQTHKAVTIGIILSIILILACLTYILLLYLGVMPVCNCNLEKQVLMIALGVASGFLIIILGCCCLQCVRIRENRISTMYNRDGKSHRSSRSPRRNDSKMVVESIE